LLGEARPEVIDTLDAAQRVVRLVADALEEVAEPLLPLAPFRHAEEARIVFVARRLEPGAEIEEW